MRELGAGHWLVGTGAAVGGAALYRLAVVWQPRAHSWLELLGLALVAFGLFWLARGVSRSAAERAAGSDVPRHE